MEAIKLKEIVDAIEDQSDELYFYLNKKSKKVVMISNDEMRAAEDEDPIEDFPEWQQEIIKIAIEIVNTDDYIELPEKSNINEYEIMEDFCLSIEDDKLRGILLASIKGKGAFKRFKDVAYRHEILENWYEFKNIALKQIAINWCKENNINYTD
ncbi:MAG: UPF0158 family protein [bacterium]